MENINKVNFYQKNNIRPLNLSAEMNVTGTESTGAASFKDTMQKMIGEMNEITNKPDELTKAAMEGKADVHDVMAAIAKSELTVQTATTITGKILQTYEKIMQISI